MTAHDETPPVHLSRAEIFERCVLICVDQLGFDRESITDTSSLRDGLGADSLDVVELVISAEQEFDIEIRDVDAERVVKFGEFVDMIAAYLAKKKG